MAKCQVFSFVDDLEVVVANGLEMRTLVGDTMSVGVVKFFARESDRVPAKSHTHGEEMSLQIRGGCAVYLGNSGEPPEGEVTLSEGATMLMPANQPHYGVNSFDAAGVCLRLNVVTPPRGEYGSKGATKVYYPLREGPRR
jgi:hypothetical protein